MWPEATLLPTVKYEKDNLYYDTYDDIILIVHAAVRRRRQFLPDFHTTVLQDTDTAAGD